jgi:hypothetical protein
MREPSTTSKKPEPSHEVGAALQSEPVAALLVPAVALVPLVAEHEQVEPSRHLHRIVGAEIVHEHDVIDDVHGDFPQRPLERAPGIVGRQHNADLLVIDHAARSPRSPPILPGIITNPAARILAKR